MEPPNFSTHIWPQFHPSFQNQLKNPQSHPENDDIEEALSLCDLPTGKPATNNPGKQLSGQHQDIDNFDFNGFNSPENQMCTADEVFFRGQILPFRHSVSLPSGLTTRTRTRNPITFSRSESVSLASSRTSESNSPSGSESTGHKPMTRNKTRNRFHSHPSPTPQIRTRSHRRPDPNPLQNWRFLQVGVLDPREIGSKKKTTKDEKPKKTKTKTKQVLMFGGCECSANEVESEVLPWRNPVVKVKGRDLNLNLNLKEESGNVGGRKDSVVASHRTAEWLRQLSI
ncbi:hypothetical protein OSB04_000085 [Centaurea solstitialis]|uniref:Uncharacterized protein n=1 Tax=Centaurea solstitialis TaxID=347529 RepID=A0AA38TNJ2_9ASTR|nr:hypothetical protein OSB04_000085 [Centaurea solstitialis]